MQHEVQALLKALLAEQQRERQPYQSLLAAISITASARQRMLEDIVSASNVALGAGALDEPLEAPARVAQDLLTEAIHKMREARGRTFGDHVLN